jgi:hypothetical protein
MNLGKLGAWEELIQELLWAWRCRAWSNPKWRDYIMRCQKEAEQEGHPEHWWIYSLWDMVQKPPHI